MGSLFPPRHVYFPSIPQHTSTIIFLHGRGSSGPELTSDLSTLSLSDLSSLTNLSGRVPGSTTTSSATQGQKSKTKTIFDHFPSCRWVFPSARTRWSEKFQEHLCEWFESDASEASSSSVREGAGPAASTSISSTFLPSTGDTDKTPSIAPSQILVEQLPGLRASVEYILRIIDEEIARLDGDASRVVLCGLSQGMALGLAVLICAVARGTRLGGFVGAMGWFPMAKRVKEMLDQIDINGRDQMSGGGDELDEPSNMGLADVRIKAIQQMIVPQATVPRENDNHAYTHTHPHDHPHIHHQEQIHAHGQQLQAPGIVNTTASLPYDIPIFLSHGEDDAWVDITLGREAYDILHQRLGFTNVSWKTYTGADVQGHWLKEPEQGDAIVEFLRHLLSSQESLRK